MCEMFNVRGSSPALKSRHMIISSSSRMHYLFLWQEGRHVWGDDFWQIVSWKDKSKVEVSNIQPCYPSNPIPHHINSTSNAIPPIHPSSLFISMHLWDLKTSKAITLGYAVVQECNKNGLRSLVPTSQEDVANPAWMSGNIFSGLLRLGFLDLRYQIYRLIPQVTSQLHDFIPAFCTSGSVFLPPEDRGPQDLEKFFCWTLISNKKPCRNLRVASKFQEVKQPKPGHHFPSPNLIIFNLHP